MNAAGAPAFQNGLARDSPALPVGHRTLSPAHSGVSLCLGSTSIQPCAQVRWSAGLGLAQVLGDLKGTFWWQILGKLQMTERK